MSRIHLRQIKILCETDSEDAATGLVNQVVAIRDKTHRFATILHGIPSSRFPISSPSFVYLQIIRCLRV